MHTHIHSHGLTRSHVVIYCNYEDFFIGCYAVCNVLLLSKIGIGLNIAQSGGIAGGCYRIPQRKTAKGAHN